MDVQRLRTWVRLFRRRWMRNYWIEFAGHDQEAHAALVRVHIRRWHPGTWWMVAKALTHVRISIARNRDG